MKFGGFWLRGSICPARYIVRIGGTRKPGNDRTTQLFTKVVDYFFMVVAVCKAMGLSS